jgi:uncharacterized protein (DUF362 family)
LCTSTASRTRREFARDLALGLAGLSLAGWAAPAQDAPGSAVALAHNPDRRAAFRTAIELLGKMDFGGSGVYLKGNYNSPDPFPATTHPDSLALVVELLREFHCGRITLIERSGMGSTPDIWRELGIPALARKLDVQLLALDDLPAEQWRKEELPGSDWKSGVEYPVFVDRESIVVQISNLKTHRFGGVFSGSLKNSVGLVAKYGRLNAGYNYMQELHSSPQQSAMIADLNVAYEPKLIFMDGMQVFTAGGPERGELAAPEIVLAGADRIALDAAGVALLRLHGEGPEQPLLGRTVFEQEQLKRAVELHLGASSAEEIDFRTADSSSSRIASQLEAILQEAPAPKDGKLA